MVALRSIKYNKKIDGWTMFNEKQANPWFPIVSEILADNVSNRFEEVINKYSKLKA
jgi:hypothetical protein